MKNRIDLISDLKKLLLQNYDDVGLSIQDVYVIKEPLEGMLHPWGPEDGDIFYMTGVYYGGGKPVIYGLFEVPVSEFWELPPPDFSVQDLPEFCRLYLKRSLAFLDVRESSPYRKILPGSVRGLPSRPKENVREAASF